MKENGTVIGNTNVRFTHTFKLTRKRIGGQWETFAPVITVSMPGFADVTVDCGFP